MKKIVTLSVLAAMVAFGANGAWAGPYPSALATDSFDVTPDAVPTPNSFSQGGAENEIYDAVNLLLGTTYTNNEQIDSLQFTGSKSVWQQIGSEGYAVVGLGAGNLNALEVYDITTPGTKINVFGNSGYSGNFIHAGTIGDPMVGVGAVLPPGTSFGFALLSTGSIINEWDSNPAFNSDGMDHLMAYDLSALNGNVIYIKDPLTDVVTTMTLDNPFLLAFEDTTLVNDGDASDLDYNDTMFLVNRVTPVPEPSTWALLGVGLVGMAAAYRRRFSF